MECDSIQANVLVNVFTLCKKNLFSAQETTSCVDGILFLQIKERIV